MNEIIFKNIIYNVLKIFKLFVKCVDKFRINIFYYLEYCIFNLIYSIF